MTYKEIISQVSETLGLPESLVDKTYRGYWKAIKEHITSLPLKEDLTEEEFDRLQPNVNIPSIGKLYVTYDRYKRLRHRNEFFEELKRKKHAENQNT